MAKTYIPQELLNNSWGYEINEYYFTIHTNENCYQNYNTWYCDCIRLYHDLDYQYSNRFTCSNNYSVSIPYSNLTSKRTFINSTRQIIIIYINKSNNHTRIIVYVWCNTCYCTIYI